MDGKQAEEFAIKAHAAQKYGTAPYEVHLRHVVKVLVDAGYGNDDVLVCAAWLHDTVEDTEVTKEDITTKFGADVADIVYRVSDEPGTNRKERKLKTYPKIKGHRGATIIKLCDRIANVQASQNNEKKWKMYRGEYDEFRTNLFVAEIADQLWKQLDDLLLS